MKAKWRKKIALKIKKGQFPEKRLVTVQKSN